MPARDKRKVVNSLKRKGFVEECGDHRYFLFANDEGKFNIRTMVSHGSQKTISTKNISFMSKQCHLKTDEFIDLVDCHMNKEEYLAILKDRGKK